MRAPGRPLHRSRGDGGRGAGRRPAITPSACCARPGVPVDRRPGRVAVSPVQRARSWTRSTCPATSRRPRRSSSRPPIARGLEPDAARRRHQPDPDRPAHGDGADGRAGGRVRPPPRGGEPVADIEVRPAELVATEVEPELVPAPDRRAAAGGAARVLRPRRHDDPRRGRAAGQGVRPDRGDGGRGPERGRRPRRARSRTASASAACRPGFAAGASTRPATTGSRCSAPWPACARRTASRCTAPTSLGVSFPDFAERLAGGAAPDGRGGDHDRRPRRRGQEHRRAGGGRAARLPATSTPARCTAS